jgi:hypothetical protein
VHYLIMISARLSIVHRHAVSRIVANAGYQQHVMSNFYWNYNKSNDGNSSCTIPKQPQFISNYVTGRYLSTAPVVDTSEIRGIVSDGVSTKHETTQKSPGHVTRTLRVLDMDVVRKILEELKSVDVNADGR